MSLFQFRLSRTFLNFRFSPSVSYFSDKTSAKQSQNLDLKGIFPPITSPFNSKGSIDFENLSKNMKRWNEIPFRGYVVQGSNGEYVYLNASERIDLVRRVSHLAAENKIIIAGSGCESTSATIELTAKMASAGADCALVISPSFYKGAMSNKSFLAHFQKIADDSPIPILLYNVPANTGLDLAPEVIVQLADHPNIIGLKDSGGDIAKLANLVFTTKDKDFQILAGSAGFLFPALMMGCVGGICALANAMGKELCELQALYEQGKYEEATELQQRLIWPNTAVTRKYGVAGLKQAMEWFGFYGGVPRLPMLPLTKEQITELKKDFTSRGFNVGF